jgi:putative lipoprotein
MPPPELVPYACGNETAVAQFRDGAVDLSLPGGDIRLPEVRSGSGARYAAEGIEFWIKGTEARLDYAGRTTINCRVGPPARWDDAMAAGIDLRAIGQEPGWLLDLDRNSGIVLKADEGGTAILTPIEAPIEANGKAVWIAGSATQRVTVTTEEAVCRDTMSGMAYPLKVRVAVNDRVREGCGIRLNP